MKTIKRYANRKLYDTELARYITLPDLEKLSTAGTPFRVICYRTKNDITVDTLITMRYFSQMRLLKRHNIQQAQLEMF